MTADSRGHHRPWRLSVIVPFHRNVGQLRLCVGALRLAATRLSGGASLTEIIIAADGAVEDVQGFAAEVAVTVLPIAGPLGPAVARTEAARVASGDLLVFVDSDVVVHEDALARLARLFVEDADLGAAFGAYDEHPADQGFFSQSRNLAHSFIHQQSNRDAHTFWAGLGAVRAPVFDAVGGFDRRFALPSVEDIDLGYRIRRAGFRIVLDPSVRGTHLKRWTFWSSVVSDIRDRGVPWTQLLSRYRLMRNDLNLTYKHRLAVVMAYALVGCLAGAMVQPVLLFAALALVGGLWAIDRAYYRFFVDRRGLAFALAWFPFHIVHHLCNGVSFVVGTLLYAGRRWAGVALPWTLPVTPWTRSESR
jgi:GT2 family glycosyltransferase